MPEKILTTDPPDLTVSDFEEYLATDNLFVDYFNTFLELPSFPEPLQFNTDTGGFEVLTSNKHQLKDKIKAVVRSQRPISSVYKNAISKPPIKLPHYEKTNHVEDEDIKTSFSVKCLDKEQGIQWIKENRLPTFLRSELYMEYRLAKLLAQIETSRGGIKLTIDQSYRPWFKPVKVERPATPVDETEEMIQRLSVTLGSSSTSQTKEWFSLAKQVETTSTSVTSQSLRPKPSITKQSSYSQLRHSPSRPMSVQSSRLDVADSGDEYLKGRAYSYDLTPPSLTKAEERDLRMMSSVTISTSPVNAFIGEAACVFPMQGSSPTQITHVVRIDPELSDGESDQGVGSEEGDCKEEEEKEEGEEKTVSYDFEISDLDSYASLFVAMTLKDAYLSIAPAATERTFNQVVDVASLLQTSPRGTPLSALDSTVFSEAILDHEKEVLNRSGCLSRQNLNDKQPKKSITFKATDNDPDCEADSVFSDETEDSELYFKFNDFKDVKSFNNFRQFLRGSAGEKITLLWLAIDRSRFSLNKNKTQSYLQRMRETFVKVGSVKRLPNELLAKYKLQHATQWTLEHLHSVQRSLVEPLLLYWAPRYLVRQQSSRDLETINDVNTKLRPMSSQSFPNPKTITLLPLRPKSCLPRIKQTSKVSSDRGHVGSDYHRYIEEEHLTSSRHHPPVKHSTPLTPVPSYLLPKVSRIIEHKKGNLEVKRPASAGPLTRQTRMRFERRKVAAAKSARERSERVTPIKPPSSVSSEISIKGSPVMESMLQALYHDTKAGLFFTQFCERSSNKSWISCIHFWFDVQEYHYLFYAEIIDKFTIYRKAQAIHSKYIVGGAPQDLGVSMATRKQISLNINPPFDELFDAAEEFVLKILIVPWNRMLGMDREGYRKVELIEQQRNLNVGDKYASCLKKRGILKEVKKPIPTEHDSIEKYEENLWLKVPEEFQSFAFEEIIRNRIELEHFRRFLEDNYAKNDLLCWLDVESFKRLPHQANEKRDEKAKDIKTKYLHKKYFFGPNSPATKDEQNQAVLAGGGWGKTLKERPPTELILELQKYVKARIDKRWLPLFLATAAFQERQRPKSQMSEVAEDVVLQKKKKRGEPWRLLDNRWQSSSRDLIEFRRALSNTVTAHQFRRYVSLKGEFLENDVLFWLEVQKYKDFCHIHNEQGSIEIKIMSIINCFISSQIPPALQIDISTEMAERIIEKRKELGPYVFREAQMTVFRVLFPHWGGFCDYRKTISDEKLTTTLERQRKRRMEKVKRQMRELEEEQMLRELKAAKEAEIPDVMSIKGSVVSDISGALLEEMMTKPEQNTNNWTYGKYVESLERDRLLLLMENEVYGRIPLESLRGRDPDVETECSEINSEEDDSKSNTSDKGSSSTRGKKFKKEKVIHSTVKDGDASTKTPSIPTNTQHNKKNVETIKKPGLPVNKEEKQENKPAVSVD